LQNISLRCSGRILNPESRNQAIASLFGPSKYQGDWCGANVDGKMENFSENVKKIASIVKGDVYLVLCKGVSEFRKAGIRLSGYREVGIRITGDQGAEDCRPRGLAMALS
jgi:hypothetical protein